jgi:hypothetical protein
LRREEVQALHHLAQRYGHCNRANAFRYALACQVQRDTMVSGSKVPGILLYARVLEACVEDMSLKATTCRWQNDHASLPTLANKGMLRWALRMTEQDIHNLERVRQHWDLQHLADAGRFAVRVQAEMDGFTFGG